MATGNRWMYVVWQKSDETDFLLTMNFILFTNQGYPLQNTWADHLIPGLNFFVSE